jgi:archaellum component FlaC
MMTTKNPGDSVQDEQFDGTEKAAESTQEINDAEASAVQPAGAMPAAEDEIRGEEATSEETAADDNITSPSDEADGKGEDQLTEKPAAETEISEISETDKTDETEEEKPAGDEPAGDEDEGTVSGEEEAEPAEPAEGEAAAADQAKAGDASDELIGEGAEASDHVEEEPVNYDEIDLPPVDYSGFSRKELVETLALIVENRPPSEIIDDVGRIKEFFYKKTKAEFNEKRLNFAKEGGNIEDYKSEPDELENRIKGILETYRSRRSDFNRIQESEKQENLRRKSEIIEQIKDLVNREEAINKTFQEFRNLQNSWHSTGIVPQTAVKDLWENYHHSVEMFYDYIKINRELRDLDLRKNLESKIVLCEKAEELLMEPNAVTAFKLLQDYHNRWREIGPVPHENKNDVWERFREATTKVNKRHHEFFEKQKDDQKKNLDAKTALCEKVEEIAAGEILTFADFKEKSDAILECQKLWKTIGFAPKKHNNKIYQRFRTACDNFFEKKRTFFSDSKEIQVKNLQLKTELCLKAEALQESTDWKETSEMLIRLQKEWKETGPVPKKYSEKIWKRFRKACDTFFTRKSEYFAGRDTSYEDNLKSKLAIIEELEAFEPGEDMKAGFEKLKDIQKRWTEIGYVPFNRKEEIARRYKEALNKKFDKLKLDDEDKNILRYRSKVDSARSNPRAASKVRSEREKFYSRIKQLESDIVLWENNIGFFAKSAKADTMIKEVEEKIAEAKRNIKMLEEKVKLIDSSMYED